MWFLLLGEKYFEGKQIISMFLVSMDTRSERLDYPKKHTVTVGPVILTEFVGCHEISRRIFCQAKLKG